MKLRLLSIETGDDPGWGRLGNQDLPIQNPKSTKTKTRRACACVPHSENPDLSLHTQCLQLICTYINV